MRDLETVKDLKRQLEIDEQRILSKGQPVSLFDLMGTPNVWQLCILVGLQGLTDKLTIIVTQSATQQNETYFILNHLDGGITLLFFLIFSVTFLRSVQKTKIFFSMILLCAFANLIWLCSAILGYTKIDNLCFMQTDYSQCAQIKDLSIFDVIMLHTNMGL